MIYVIYILAAVAICHFIASAAPHFLTRRRTNGCPDNGIVIFVESLRWLGVPWGMRTVAKGLNQAGFDGEFLYWQWHSSLRGWLVLPVIMDSRMMEAEARRLGEFVTDCRRKHPNRPIRLIGYSAGGYVMIRALEMLGDDIQVNSSAIIAGAFSPKHDLSAAASRINGKLTVCWSPGDWILLGLGMLIFGSADRQHRPAIGMVGPRTQSPAIQTICWNPRMLRLGHMGGHFSAGCAGFVRRHLAPAIGIAPGKTD